MVSRRKLAGTRKLRGARQNKKDEKLSIRNKQYGGTRKKNKMLNIDTSFQKPKTSVFSIIYQAMSPKKHRRVAVTSSADHPLLLPRKQRNRSSEFREHIRVCVENAQKEADEIHDKYVQGVLDSEKEKTFG